MYHQQTALSHPTTMNQIPMHTFSLKTKKIHSTGSFRKCDFMIALKHFRDQINSFDLIPGSVQAKPKGKRSRLSYFR